LPVVLAYFAVTRSAPAAETCRGRPLIYRKINISTNARRPERPRKRRFQASRRNVVAKPADRGLDAAFAVGNAERMERDFDDAERSQHHRRVDMAHMGDPERLAGQFA